MNWKDFFYYQRSSQGAVILLLLLIALAIIANVLISSRRQTQFVITQNDSLTAEFERFLQSLHEKEKEIDESSPTSYRDNRVRENRPARVASSIISSDKTPASQPSPSFPKAEKLASGETISLNETDTAQWKKIPGIGSAFAARIVNYRQKLGGFSSLEQLREVYGVDDDLFARISPYIRNDGRFRQIAINNLEFKELLQHPYLNYDQVKAIMDLRRRKGRIESVRELEMLSEFSAEDIKKLTPYLQF